MAQVAYSNIFPSTISVILFAVDHNLELRDMVRLVNQKRHKHIDTY